MRYIRFNCQFTRSCGINSKEGIYLAAEAGLNFTKNPPGAALFAGSPVYLHPYIGYQFNDYYAVEGGYYWLVNSSHSSDPQIYLGPDHYREYAYNLAGKIMYPLENGLSLFAKAGLAYVSQDVYNQTFIFSPPAIDAKTKRILPLLGLGVSYHFTQSIAMDLSATRMQGSGVIQDINLVGLGLSYTF